MENEEGHRRSCLCVVATVCLALFSPPPEGRKKTRPGGVMRELVRGDGKVEKVVLVISSRILPSEAVLRWLAGHPEGQRACAGPLIRLHSGPGCHPECSGKSFLLPPGKHPLHSRLCGSQTPVR